MSISNNRSFFRDSITDDWTKKDWALNLIPLGGIASVAYEIGSACLSSRDRTAKISEDFFKLPIQTTIKKIAQCLWVPIVVYGALKLVCLIVNACWNRCFSPTSNRPKEESQVIDPRATDPCVIIPPEVLVHHIFSYLNLHELGVITSVNKEWSLLASTPILWQSAIYREIAFSSKNWAEWNADLVKDVDMRQEMQSLPDIEEFRRLAFPGKSIRETHVLVRMPRGLTMKKLGELAKKYFPNNDVGYRSFSFINKLEDKPVDESVWLLMTKDVLPGSRNKSYCKQMDIIKEMNYIAELNETTPYEVPTALEAATCMLAEYSRSKNRLFSDSPSTYTYCKEFFQGYQVVIGGFAPAGLDVTRYYHYVGDAKIGLAALWKF